MRLWWAARDSRLSSSLNSLASQVIGEDSNREGHGPVELVLGSTFWSCKVFDGELSRLKRVHTEISEGSVANRRGGVAAAFSSSSESSITLRFVMSEYT